MIAGAVLAPRSIILPSCHVLIEVLTTILFPDGVIVSDLLPYLEPGLVDNLYKAIIMCRT